MTNQQSHAQVPPHHRLDSERYMGMPYGAFFWMEMPPFALDRARDARPPEDPAEHFKHFFYGPKFELTTTNSKLLPGIKDSTYVSLPFRALEDPYLPLAIQQRWDASWAASKSAEWRLWFRKLNSEKQKKVVQHLSKITKDKFWAGLWLEYEEWSQPRRTRHVAAAARALVILEREMLKQMEEQEWARTLEHNRPLCLPFELPRPHPQRIQPLLHPQRVLPRPHPQRIQPLPHPQRVLPLPHSQRIQPAECPEPLSAPMTPQNIASLHLRLAPSYFRLPNHAVRFATQIFGCKSYEEAVAEQKANFNSWVQEAKTRRIEGMPDHVVWGSKVVHKNKVPKPTAKKNQPPTLRRSNWKKRVVSRFTEEEGC